MAYLTEIERKEKITREFDFYSFTSCADLSCGVRIKPCYKNKGIIKFKDEAIASETARFILWWSIHYFLKLNGFSGIDTIKFIIEE